MGRLPRPTPRIAHGHSLFACLSLFLLQACAPVAAPPLQTGPPATPGSNLLTRESAIRFVTENLQAGDREEQSLQLLQDAGFSCRILRTDEYAEPGPGTVKLVSCHVATDHTAAGYTLVYANLGVSRDRRVTMATPGSYPVVYRNLRRDERGGIVVIPDEGHRSKK